MVFRFYHNGDLVLEREVRSVHPGDTVTLNLEAKE